jgi:hypothetical protein
VTSAKRVAAIFSMSLAGRVLDAIACVPFRLVTRGIVTSFRNWP